MSATTVIATASNDLQALASTILLKQTALETAVNAIGPQAQKLLADATTDGVNALAQAAGLSATVTSAIPTIATDAATGNIAKVGVDVEGVVVEVSTAFQAVFNFVKGVIEGAKGQAAPSGATGAEQAGDTLGQDGRGLEQALVDSWNNLIHGTPMPTAPSGS